ncbi:GNAT family N-acetyltransferase [Nesterenkonia suensis]
MSEPQHHLRTGVTPDVDALAALYGAVGWTSYTDDVTRLHRAVASSYRVATAWSPSPASGPGAEAMPGERAELVGLARILSDGETIAYLQDLLVQPAHRRRGIAGQLVQAVLAPVAHLRQQVPLTDAEPAQRSFYESVGFTEIRDVPPTGLRAFVRWDPPPG